MIRTEDEPDEEPSIVLAMKEDPKTGDHNGQDLEEASTSIASFELGGHFADIYIERIHITLGNSVQQPT